MLSWGEPFGKALRPIAPGEWIVNAKTLAELHRPGDRYRGQARQLRGLCEAGGPQRSDVLRGQTAPAPWRCVHVRWLRAPRRARRRHAQLCCHPAAVVAAQRFCAGPRAVSARAARSRRRARGWTEWSHSRIPRAPKALPSKRRPRANHDLLLRTLLGLLDGRRGRGGRSQPRAPASRPGAAAATATVGTRARASRRPSDVRCPCRVRRGARPQPPRARPRPSRCTAAGCVDVSGALGGRGGRRRAASVAAPALGGT